MKIVDKMESYIETYIQHHMDTDLQIVDLVQFVLQCAEIVRKGVDEADSYKSDCGEINIRVIKLVNLLKQAWQKASKTNAPGLYERPTRRIMVEVLKVLERALGLVRKCKRSGMLKRVMTITTAADFKKMNHWLDSSIGDVKWVVNISSTGDERSELGGLPPIASNDPMLAHIWEQISIVHIGTLEEKVEGAEYLGNLAKSNERNVKIIIEEGGAGPLLRLLKEGNIPGQDAAATALTLLATNRDRVMQLRKEGASSVFTHLLGSHSTSMKVQIEVAKIVAKFAMLDSEAQTELANEGAIRLLVALLAHQTNTVVGMEGPASIHLNTKTNTVQRTDLVVGGNDNAHRAVSNSQTPVATAALTMMDRIKSSAPPSIPENHSSSARMNAPLRQGSRAQRDMESPEVMHELKVVVTDALWRLAAGHVGNCKLITDTCALLCFAKIIKHSKGPLKRNAVLAVKEIAVSAGNDSELRRAAFKTNSPSAKAVVEQLLQLIASEDEDYPKLQKECCKAIGSLARIFPAPAEAPIKALTSALIKVEAYQEPEVIDVATEAALALSKFASDENYLHLEHSKNIIQEGAVEGLVVLALNFGHSESQLSALELLCYLALNVPTSEVLAAAKVVNVLGSTIHVNHLSQTLANHETSRQLITEAISKLELHQPATGRYGAPELGSTLVS